MSTPLHPRPVRIMRRRWRAHVAAVATCGLAGAIVSGADGALRLRDFKPESMLRLPETPVLRARFPVIDMHNHINDATTLKRPRASPSEVVRWMDECNVRRVVILTGGWGEVLQGVIDTMVKPYPDRFTVFFQLDWDRVNEPDFVDRMLPLMRDAVKRGARGMKILKRFGLGDRDAAGKLIRIDDPRFDPIWAECGKLGVPVSIHVADPIAFFRPVDATNERYDELQARPEWSFHGRDFPGFHDLLTAVEGIFERHPKTTFVWLHVGNWPENLDYIGQVLDRRPNVVVEIGARHAELGRQPRRAKAFFVAYQDRVLFGSDFQISAPMYRNIFRCLETEDEYFDYHQSPGQGRWKIYGLGLPDAVLEKVYHRNAERILALDRAR